MLQEPQPFAESLMSPGNERRALFASDRGGGDDLYEARFATDQVTAITRLDELASDADDTAPYVDPQRGILVFASDRAGGYDLYCSKRVEGRWLPPVPMPFNTEHDEFGRRCSRSTTRTSSWSRRTGRAARVATTSTPFDACR